MEDEREKNAKKPDTSKATLIATVAGVVVAIAGVVVAIVAIGIGRPKPLLAEKFDDMANVMPCDLDEANNNWCTDSSDYITIDDDRVKLTSADFDVQMVTPLVAINKNKTYVVTSSLQIQGGSSRAFHYYIDEYDSNNEWINGDYYYEGKIRKGSLQEVRFDYNPSSDKVAAIRVQYIVDEKSGAVAYLDDVKIEKE